MAYGVGTVPTTTHLPPKLLRVMYEQEYAEDESVQINQITTIDPGCTVYTGCKYDKL